MKTANQRENEMRWLRVLMRPLIRFCLRRSQTFQDFSAMARELFVELAQEEILKISQKVNVSRLSVLTGLNRREVTKIFREGRSVDGETISIPLRVVGQWVSDADFHTKAGRPRSLTVKGDDSEFNQLCGRISTNVHPGTVLFELERMGVISKTKGGVKLLKDMSRVGTDPDRSFRLLARDIDAIFESVEENTMNRQQHTNLHIHTEYDNVLKKDLVKIRKWLLEEGKRFHKRVRDYLSKYDQDINPTAGDHEDGAKVVVTAFSHTSPYWDE